MSDIEHKDSLSAEELNTVLAFSQGLYNGLGGFGFYTPFSQNQNLLALNNNGSKPTYQDLLKALENSPYDYGKLSSYSELYFLYVLFFHYILTRQNY